MLAVIEGPDQSGKSTLLEALRPLLPEATFVGREKTHASLYPVIHHCEVQWMKLWDQLYRDDVLYVCDRHTAVSGVVYAKFMRRPLLIDVTPWLPRLFVLYLKVPLEELRKRHANVGDNLVEEGDHQHLVRLYEYTLLQYEHAVFDGTLPVEVLARTAAAEILSVWKS